MAFGIDPGVLAAYGGAMATGLLHGLEPGHGWPLTVRAAAKQERPTRFAVTASLVLAAGHFISTLVVVLLFFVVAQLLGLLERPLYLIGGSLLIAVALYPYLAAYVRRRRANRRAIEHEVQHKHHDALATGAHSRDGHAHVRHGEVADDGWAHVHSHLGGSIIKAGEATLRTIFVSALILGFVHEEEFALIGFIAAGANALLVGLLYGLCVTAAIVGVTWVAIRLAARKGGEMDQGRLTMLGTASSVVMLVIGSYYIARGLGLAA